MSRLVVVCLLGYPVVYFADISLTTSRFVVFMYSHLGRLVLNWPSNNNNSTEERTVTNMTDMDVLYTTTTMTFNTDSSCSLQEVPVHTMRPSKCQTFTKEGLQNCLRETPTMDSLQCLHAGILSSKPVFCLRWTVTSDTDVVIVYGVLLGDNFQPPHRWPNQTYILSGWESPVHTRSDYISNRNSPWNARINLIMSYRVDSDVFVPYSSLKFSPKPLKERPNYYEIAKNKTGTVVWLVSNCKTPSRRQQYVTEMQKYIDVDILGGCGRPCARDNNCYDWDAKYKFYLAFENSLCTDYVTEKFFKIFDNNIPVIPVVRGGADYDKYFPNFTYINSAHFKTPKDLALHLKHLAADLDTYSKYLEYKDLYVHNENIDQLCTLCSFLHTHKLPDTKTYNLKAWMNDGHCHDAKDL